MKSPLMRIVGHVVWVVTAVAAINVGLMPMEYDLFALIPMSSESVSMLLQYFIGACGVVSLVMFVMGCMSGHSSCSCCK